MLSPCGSARRPRPTTRPHRRPVKPLNTGVRWSRARSLRARNPVPQPARTHFCPPPTTTSATSYGASTTPKPWIASTISSRSPMTCRIPSMSVRYPVRESTRLTATAAVFWVICSLICPGVTRPWSVSSQAGVTTWSACAARTAAKVRLGNSPAERRTVPVIPNSACMRPVLVFGWNTTWSDANPVRAEIASRTRWSSRRIPSTLPNRALARISFCPAASASTDADNGPTRP